MELAPIALFVYNRLNHTQKVIDSLKKNLLSSDSILYIFSDGYKNETVKNSVLEVRDYLKKIQGFKEIIIIERNENYGLAKSIISGVTEIINKHGKIIVLEDDLYLSPYFLKYMNDALNKYENENKVACIHAYVYPVEKKLPNTFFLRGADCWGWATWKRGWDLFEEDGQKLLKNLKEKNLTKRFDFNDSYGFTKMLEDQIEGKNNSWAIRWNASVFLENKYTLYPGKSLVYNTGLDGSGTHCNDTDTYDVLLTNKEINLEDSLIEDSKIALIAFEDFFRKSNKKQNLISRILSKIIMKLRKL